MSSPSWQGRLDAAQRNGGFLPASLEAEAPSADAPGDEVLAWIELALEAGRYTAVATALEHARFSSAADNARATVLRLRLALERWDQRPDEQQLERDIRHTLESADPSSPILTADAHLAVAQARAYLLDTAHAVTAFEVAASALGQLPDDDPRRLRLELDRARHSATISPDGSHALESAWTAMRSALGDTHAWTARPPLGLQTKRRGRGHPSHEFLNASITAISTSEGATVRSWCPTFGG